MDGLTLILLVAAILGAATLVRATLGFGDALLAMPVLTLLLGLSVATPLCGLIAITNALIILAGSWRAVAFRAAGQLVVASLAGIPLGLWLLAHAPAALVQGVLGVLLVAFGLLKVLPLPRWQGWQAATTRWHVPGLVYIMGFGAGVLGGAYNINGPPVVVYGMLAGWDAARFRATLQGYFVLAGVGIVLGHGLAGLWTPTVGWLYLAALPGALLAHWLGASLHARLPQARFAQGVYLLIALSGALLLV